MRFGRRAAVPKTMAHLDALSQMRGVRNVGCGAGCARVQCGLFKPAPKIVSASVGTPAEYELLLYRARHRWRCT